MAIAGTLAVNILALTDKFNKGIKSAQKALKGFRGQISGVSKGLTSFSSLLVGAVGVGSAVAFTKSTFGMLDALSKTSEKLGIATEELGKWRFASELAGISSNTLDMAMQRMIRRVGEASLGTGAAAKTLERMGFNAKELAKLNPSKQFELIGKAINSITNKGEQLASAMAIFDTEGVGLVNLFASNLKEAAKSYKDLGLAARDAKAGDVVPFIDAVTKLRAALSASGGQFVIGVTPDALRTVNAMTTLAENVGLIKTKPTAFTTTNKAAAALRGKPPSAPSGLRGVGRQLLRAGLPERKAIVEGLGEFLADFSSDPRSRSRRIGIATEADKERRSGNRERRRQTQILIESLEIQRRAVVPGGTTVTLSPATFE